MSRVAPLFALFLLVLPFSATAGEEALPATQVIEVEEGAEVVRPRGPEAERLLAILESGREEVRLLVENMETIDDLNEQRSLQLQISAVKQAWRVRFLEEHVAIAEAKNDEVALDAARTQLESFRQQIEGVDQAQPTVARPVPNSEGSR